MKRIERKHTLRTLYAAFKISSRRANQYYKDRSVTKRSVRVNQGSNELICNTSTSIIMSADSSLLTADNVENKLLTVKKSSSSEKYTHLKCKFN